MEPYGVEYLTPSKPYSQPEKICKCVNSTVITAPLNTFSGNFGQYMICVNPNVISTPYESTTLLVSNISNKINVII